MKRLVKKDLRFDPVWRYFDIQTLDLKGPSAVGKLAASIDVAISQEQNLNQDAADCIGKLTSNIGKIISDICSIQDPV